MRLLAIIAIAVGLPALSAAEPQASDRTRSADHAVRLADGVKLDQTAKAKKVAVVSSRVALIQTATTPASVRLLTKKKQRLTVRDKQRATLIHVSSPR